MVFQYLVFFSLYTKQGNKLSLSYDTYNEETSSFETIIMFDFENGIAELDLDDYVSNYVKYSL